MTFVSTAGVASGINLAEAIAQGVARDGGLFMPDPVERLEEASIRGLHGKPFLDVASALAARQFADDLTPAEARALVEAALDFDIPLRALDEHTHVLELFHGPTLAFKDVGARTLARLIRHFGVDKDLTVLVATSGDTGSAVAHAFFGLPGVRVVVLYPRGQVSRLQEAQFATLGGNVTALAVGGTFDDCQRLAKDAFLDPFLAPLRLTSANSINVGRLLPQVWYYWHAALSLRDAPRPLVFSTPSGNFGNLTAGLLAKRMGAPIDGFVAATNVNDVVPEYLRTGVFAPRASKHTVSNAMDVGSPSNLVRIQALYGGDANAIAADVFGSSHDDDATRRAIAEVADRYDYVMDPHTAVGYLGLQDRRSRLGPATGVILGTAHPAKFPEVVEPVLGRSVPLPAALADCLARPILSNPLEASGEGLREVLLSLGRP